MHDWTWYFIVACFIFWLLFWLATAFNVKRTVETYGDHWSRIVVIATLVLWLLLGGVGFGAKPVYVWHTSLGLGIITDIFAFIGILITVWSRIVLGRNWSANVTFKEGHELIRSGPHTYVRHPIYSGGLLFASAAVVHAGQLYWFFLLGLLSTGIYLKCRDEEKLMTKHFPKQYTKYMKQTKALIPFVV